MRIIGLSVVILLCAAGLAGAGPAGFVEVQGGFANTSTVSSSDTLFEAGVHVARHLAVFGDFGGFHNLQSASLESSIQQTEASLLNDDGLEVSGVGRAPSGYGLGGLRLDIPATKRFVPYAFGSLGAAKTRPAATFTYVSGLFPDDSIANPGQDVTTTIVTMGDFAEPAASNELMMTTGAGATFALARHVLFDARYRYSRVDTATPIHAQGMNIGVGVTF